jgi:hypothetical protein
MRAPLFVLAATAALTAVGVALWLSSSDREHGNTDREDVVVARDGDASRDEGRAETVGPRTLPAVAVPDDAENTSPDEGSRRTYESIHVDEVALQAFRGAALIHREGERPEPVSNGTLSMEIWTRGERETVEASILEGRFEVEIPRAARVRLTGGLFEGERVRFRGLRTPFDPSEEDHAIVGVPYPLNVLRVVDGGQGSALTGVRVRRTDDESAALLADVVDEGEVLIADGVAPVILPWIESSAPVRLRVSAPGYAAANVMVDPNVAGDREVRLWPSSDLTVRVTGAGRDKLRALVLFREETGGVRPVAGMFAPSDPGVTKELDALVFDVKGVAGLPHRIVAKGYDGKGRTVDLAETRIVLGPGEARAVTLRIGG